MRDFPPPVADFESPLTPGQDQPASGVHGGTRTGGPGKRASRGVFADPDTRSPARFLFWLLAQQRPILFWSAVTAVLEWLPGAIGPYVIGKIVDEGITGRDLDRVGELALVMLGLVLVGVLAGVLNHTFAVRGWLIGMYGPMKLVGRKAVQLGHVLPQRTPTGEVLSVAAGDAEEFGALTEIVSRTIGALAAYLVIAALVLSTSFWLGVVVLVVAPMIVMFALPLLGPLQRREEIERTRLAELTGMATDIVAGLRILRGIGGEQTFARNYADQSQRTRHAGVAAGVWQSAVEACSVLFSGLFLVMLTWLGVREVLAGQLSVGGLISFFGYAVFMVWPIQTFYELAQRGVRSLVSAGKAVAVLSGQPPWHPPSSPLRLPERGDLHDEQSGFTAEPGRLTMIVSAVPDDAAALADRLGRYLPADHEPVKLDTNGLGGRRARRLREQQQAELARLVEHEQALAGRKWGVSLGFVDLADVPIAAVRERIVVSDSGSQVFAGTLQEAIDPHGSLTREQAEEALYTAAADDVFTAMDGGWQGELEERGRGLSGGQRQRVVLARVLARDPEILVLVEPTSAVDAHTEALIAERLADHRAGRTTVVITSSPLLLHHADRVALLAGRVVTAYGTHEELLRTNRGYRSVVARALDAETGEEER
jgi:ABC-type multidrug transport system fused ATPase/permease subunit